jgi:hypothetical protein
MTVARPLRAAKYPIHYNNNNAKFSISDRFLEADIENEYLRNLEVVKDSNYA